MDQRIAVHAFERRRHAQRRLAVGVENRAALSMTRNGRRRLPPFSTPWRIAAISRRRPRDLARERAPSSDLPQQRLDGRRPLAQMRLSNAICRRHSSWPGRGSRHSDVAQEAKHHYAGAGDITGWRLGGTDRRSRNRRAGHGGKAESAATAPVSSAGSGAALRVAIVLALIAGGADLSLPAVLRASGVDADAEGSGDLLRLRPALGVDRRCRAGAGPFGHHVGGRPVLLPSRRRSRRTERRRRRCAGRRGDARRLDHHHADGEEPLPVVAAAGQRCARSSNCRWPSISTR